MSHVAYLTENVEIKFLLVSARPQNAEKVCNTARLKKDLCIYHALHI